MALSDLFNTLGKQILTDVEGNASGLLVAFFTNIKATPSIQNVLAQGAILQASALLQLPNLETQAIAQFADTGLAALASLKSAPPAV